MTSEKSSIDQISKIGAIAGILSIIFYFLAAVASFIPDSIGRLLGFAFPLLWIISFIGLYHFLRKQNHTPSLEIAYIFGIIGAAIALSFIVVQSANFIWHDAAMETANSEDAKALLKSSYAGVNRVQLGLDVAFDIFVTISWILFGLNIAKSPNFSKILGYIGSLLALGLLAFNMYTFPNPPADSGLFDIGPLLALWMFVFYIWFAVALFKQKKI
jgi:hypothetical protein